MAKLWLTSALKLLWAAYLLLTSVYCLLAYLPYTYVSVIKEPPYVWIVWFVQHQAALAWLALMAAGLAYSGWRSRAAYRLAIGSSAIIAAVITAHPFLSSLRND